MAIETLGEAYSLGWRLTVRCTHGKEDNRTHARECIYRKELDLETLVCTRGRGFPLSRLESRLKCPKCGSRRMVVMFTVPPQAYVQGTRA